MKLIVLGRHGQVGRALQPALAPFGDVVALGRSDADLEHPEQVAARIVAERPQVVVNAAAYTAVDAAEDDRIRAWTINADAVGAIGQAAREVDALVVHYSTDYVYDGLAAGFQTEEQPTSPASVYGASKLAGEALLRQSGARHLIFRTSWVYAAHGKNFPLTILRLARERDRLTVVSDQIGAPTSAGLIAAVAAAAIPQALSEPDKLGLYHLAASGETSWYGFAQVLVAAALAVGGPLKVMPDAVAPIASTDYPAKAKRPANSRLDTTKLRATFGVALPPWQDGVRQLITTLHSEGRV